MSLTRYYLQPLSLSKILSEPVPHNPKEKRKVFVNYTTSILELFSVERMDKALLESIQREDPAPEYTKSEIVTEFLVAMPRAAGSEAMEDISLLPELEVGVTSTLHAVCYPNPDFNAYTLRKALS
ncbi:hypothetical protein FS837_013030 [Tulasnella sp. UAMH 9824]|nr:hypothetical protein FS837_013030 [Tulasnella sp. UAMH 9824]